MIAIPRQKLCWIPSRAKVVIMAKPQRFRRHRRALATALRNACAIADAGARASWKRCAPYGCCPRDSRHCPLRSHTWDDGRAALIIEQTAARWKSALDVLINNAGRGSYFSPLTFAARKTPAACLSLNFFAPFHLAQLAAPWLKKTKRHHRETSVSSPAEISLPWLPVCSLASKVARWHLSLPRCESGLAVTEST